MASARQYFILPCFFSCSGIWSRSAFPIIFFSYYSGTASLFLPVSQSAVHFFTKSPVTLFKTVNTGSRIIFPLPVLFHSDSSITSDLIFLPVITGSAYLSQNQVLRSKSSPGMRRYRNAVRRHPLSRLQHNTAVSAGADSYC